MSKSKKRRKTQQKQRKQNQANVSLFRKAGGRIVTFVKCSSTASLIVASCVVLLVMLFIIFGTRSASRNKAAGASSDTGKPTGSSVSADTSSSRDGSVTYKDPSDTSAPAPGIRSPGNSEEETAKLIDLTVLSSTMIYAEVYNIMSHPNEYMGKTVKMSGPYYSSYYDETGLYYHYVVIEDATSCCQQGLEFIWNGEHAYPDDYPEESTNIEVNGVFRSYDELGRTYYYIAVDELSIIN